MTTYTKLRDGSWGVKVQGTASPGQVVIVEKKSGERKVETIAKVLWAGDGVSLCAIERSESSSSSRSSYSYRGRRSGAGSAAPVRGYSSYCTGRSSCGCYDCAS